MRRFAPFVSAAAIVMALSITSAGAWSLRDEVVVTGQGLTLQLVWELINSKTYCQSAPPNLDRLNCITIPDPGEFWIGLDAAGNGYGTINGVDAAGEYFDIYRQPAGTKQSQQIVRITKRKEPVFGQVTKIMIASGWEINQTDGSVLIALTGSCLSTTCTAQGDTTDHLAVLKLSGLPTLFDLALTYQPPAGLALRMPVRPEALPSADSVDLYYGPAASLANLASATPLACNVAPGAAPGSIVTVADPLPNPAVGQGRYYVAAVRHGADRRAGRRTLDGSLVGRDTSGLASCP